MASMQDRIKFKRTTSNCDTWSTREQLCLASSVLKSGDQNWISVSRSLKPFVEKEPLKPTDWFSPKSCAIQYACLLENADTPKRKKRESGETTGESIVRKLTQERVTELSQMLNRQREEYLRLKTDLNHFKSSAISDEKLEKMWLDIQQEEREMEQKTRTHMAWLAKRQQQQKQDMSSPSISTSIVTQTRKAVEGTTEVLQESTATESLVENDEEKKTNRGGRSPLLTSLLKSPSPTTQTVQSFPSTPVQVSSPTITSLLGSSPKALNAQMTQKVSPQLQQLVSTAIASANTTPERPSVGAPTLSMLLEMPASTQRGSLPNLQTTTPTTNVSHAQQQQTTTIVAATSEVHNFQQAAQSQTQVQQAIQNEAMAATTMSTVPATATTSTNISVSENIQMQIIDHIDVMRKDIMVDVMDKDEINDIIGDIEELIKEEIKEDIPNSPQTIDTSGSTTTTTTTAVINSLTSMPQQATEVLIPTTGPRPQPRDVDEAVSLSDSPQSEMAIEEIDSSTSNIAEIIGTVAIDSQEPKIIVTEITETIPNTSETKSETSTCEKRTTSMEQLVPKTEIKDEETSNDTSIEEKQSDAETKSVGASSNVEIEKNNSKLLGDMKETINETTEDVEEEVEEEEETEVTAPIYKESSDSVKEQKEPPEDIEGKHNAGLDQLEIYLAKITGDQQDVPSAEIVSISSEMTNDLPSAEDTEKSQDISLILEDDESSQSTESKKKAVTEERIVENTVENTESLELFKEESIKEKNVAEIKEESSIKSQTEETNEETLEIGTELKKEKIKDSSEDATSSILQDVEVKEEETDKEPTDENEDTKQVTVEEVKSVKSEPVEATTTDAEIHIKTESVEVKFEESKAETEPEASDSFYRKSPLHGSSEEDKKEKMEVKEKKEEKEDVKKTMEGEQSVKKEVESTVVEEPGELDEEESSLSKLSSNRAMKTYSKKQNIAVDSEPENESTGEGADYRAWKKAVMLVYNRLATHKYASVFLRPITEDQAPGYHSVIFRPMDLSTIKKNIDNGTIRSTMHFQRDVMLMFQNAIMYNKHDTFIFKMAVSMQEECLQHMQILVQATGEGTFRRETRTAASSSSEANENSLKRKRSHITPSPHDTDTPRSKKRRKSEND
ncbi:PREDICTED: bromodomain-containing protein 8 isoform X1 [Trachymyrmex septentrionalis]|uniref:bromodomain-containing protein 8 isoform X1 n=1 Tax=Trachymyrmex septentrionalis TaxID=34720 RepID=UPI00084EDA83|nr:PREDICTED: bromodomain-containing protein 8 isoform X1 [Trachymyrmex septentrionalis]